METWIQEVLNSNQTGFTLLIAVILLGFISVFTCACNFSIIGMIAGYSGTIGSMSKKQTVLLNGLFFLLGLLISMTIIGGIIGFASELISNSIGSYWKIAAGLISLFFGLFSMDLLPFKMPSLAINTTNRKSGTIPSLVFGLTIGGLSLVCSSCCNPVFPVVIAISFIKGSFVWGILLMLAYALGYGITLTVIIVGIGLGLGKTSHKFIKLGVYLKYTAGIIMIVMGFYFLITF